MRTYEFVALNMVPMYRIGTPAQLKHKTSDPENREPDKISIYTTD